MKGLYAIVIIMVILTTATTSLLAVNLPPVYDTYTSKNGGCFGTDPTILTGKYEADGHDEHGMLYFDLSVYMGQQVTSAVLNINRYFGCPEHPSTTEFRHLTTAWDETYDGTHLPFGDTVWASEFFNTTGWCRVDITGLVQAWLDGDMPNYGVVMVPIEPSGESQHRSREFTNEAGRPYLALELPGAATPTPMPTATPTMPSITCTDITMPSDMFHPGDVCSCTATVFNMEGHALTGYPLFVVLNVYGVYFFGPSFSKNPDNYLDEYPSFGIGMTEVQVLPEFEWPEGAGEAAGIVWLSALTNPEMTTLIGDFDTFTFGWEE